VADFAHAAVRLDEQAERVRMRAPIAEASRRLLLRGERRVPRRRMIEVLVPPQQVADGRQQAAVAVHVLERHVLVVAVGAAVVGNGAVFDNPREVIAP